jgi:hypothetical protein
MLLTRVTNTPRINFLLLTDFPLQQLLHERAFSAIHTLPVLFIYLMNNIKPKIITATHCVLKLPTLNTTVILAILTTKLLMHNSVS